MQKNVIVIAGDCPNELGGLQKVIRDAVSTKDITVRAYLSVRDALAALYLIENTHYKISLVISHKIPKQHEVIDLLKRAHRELPEVSLIVIGEDLDEPLGFDYTWVREPEELEHILYDLAK